MHLDGARLANAVAAGFDLKAVSRIGVDILVMGGTKAGSTPTEAVVFLNKALGRRLDARLEARRPAGLQGPVPGRAVARPAGRADAVALGGRAAHANAMAQKLAALMPFPLRHPVEANGLFVDMDDAALERLHA